MKSMFSEAESFYILNRCRLERQRQRQKMADDEEWANNMSGSDDINHARRTSYQLRRQYVGVLSLVIGHIGGGSCETVIGNLDLVNRMHTEVNLL